ncbi:MAG TPA: hypothetical protein VL361_05990 [Candidatus Limnocylindrales bacterium]|jgi:hypothetical protein|nr:hypothetical protein [Candidatus Limnocylindrales bacterium]
MQYCPLGCISIPTCLGITLISLSLCTAAETQTNSFYLPADPHYTLIDSVQYSVGFTLNRTLKPDDQQHLVSISSFVDPDGNIMGWHDFGNLEGPGWAANAVGGAWEIYRLGGFLHKPEWQSNAVAILEHVLQGGFIDEQTGFIKGYRETTTDRFCLNYKHNSDWFCPGSMAKVAFQLLLFADALQGDQRAQRMSAISVRCADWIQKNIEQVPNGWFPRRTDAAGKIHRQSPDGGQDSFWQTSADSLFILQLQAALTQRHLADYRQALKEKIDVFVRAGGIFGSINHDTYDPLENVACSVAFRTLLLSSRVLHDKNLKGFAFEHCLTKLDQFKICEDRNGVATRGLLYMEKSWDTAYLWENAEAALAYFEAALETRKTDPTKSHEYELAGLVILRATAKHHYGTNGFLTEGVDWNNHVGQQHHIDQAKFGAIRYTEPFLNNQHIAEPTLFYLENLARSKKRGDSTEWLDLEGNRLWHQTRR